MTMPAPALQASDLACRRGDRVLFAGLSLDLQAGEALQLAGANGIGKSSLMRILGAVSYTHLDVYKRQGQPHQQQHERQAKQADLQTLHHMRAHFARAGIGLCRVGFKCGLARRWQHGRHLSPSRQPREDRQTLGLEPRAIVERGEICLLYTSRCV